MARVKLSEYRAKNILTDGYSGYALQFSTIDEDISKIPSGRYVLKVDQGIKKRGKQGLVAVDIAPEQVKNIAEQWHAQGFDRFILEELIPHEQYEERYLSVQRTREGLVISYSSVGGIDVEDNADKVQTFYENKLSELAQASGLSELFMTEMLQKMNVNHLSFVEINPYIIRNETPILLDAAVLVDSAGEYFVNSWTSDDCVELGQKTNAEQRVSEMDANSPAALKLTVLNPDASLWLLLSGGGASIAIADTVQAAGCSEELGNYGEYSGGPTAEETYLYTKEILNLVKASTSLRKAIIIAGGVANFTDVAKTFKGVIQALNEVASELESQDVKVFVRRGGPNEVEGLQRMEEFLKEKNLFGAVYGSDTVLTQAATDALQYIGGPHA